jgi:hypothetical protein
VLVARLRRPVSVPCRWRAAGFAGAGGAGTRALGAGMTGVRGGGAGTDGGRGGGAGTDGGRGSAAGTARFGSGGGVDGRAGGAEGGEPSAALRSAAAFISSTARASAF